MSAPEASATPKLDFFVIGVQKGGTTALATYLRGHPGLQISRRKEVHFFDEEMAVDWSAPDYSRLHEQFDWDVPSVLRGEATPVYIYWPQALERLYAYNPAARLIVLLRHPALRAYSHWRMSWQREIENLPFDRAITKEGSQRAPEDPDRYHRHFSYIERGFYSGQVRRLLSLFPADQVHFIRTDQLWASLSATLSGIETFLGVAPALGREAELLYILPKMRRRRQVEQDVPPTDTRRYLDALYHADIAETARLTGLDLSDWQSPDYSEPMQPR